MIKGGFTILKIDWKNMLVIINSVNKLITKTNSWPNLKMAFVRDIRHLIKTNMVSESPDQRPIGLKSITSDSICIKNIINIGKSLGLRISQLDVAKNRRSGHNISCWIIGSGKIWIEIIKKPKIIYLVVSIQIRMFIKLLIF